MSEEIKESQPPGTHKGLYYRLSCEEWLSVSKNLKFAELRVFYYLKTLDPFGDRQLDLKVIDIAATTGLTKGTVSKALQALACKEYIDLELVSVRVRVKSAKKFPTGNSLPARKFPVGFGSFPQETCKSCRKLSENLPPSEPAQSEAFKNGNVPIEQTYLKQEQIGASTADRTKENLVHPQDSLLQKISKTGVDLNETVQRAIARLRQKLEPADVERNVEKALSSLREQQQQGVVRNPTGFFVAAIKYNFTANEAKRNARAKQPDAAPRASPTPPLDEIAISQQIDTYLMDGHRDWAIAKLKQLYNDHPQNITELLSIRRDWNITLKDLQEPSP